MLGCPRKLDSKRLGIQWFISPIHPIYNLVGGFNDFLFSPLPGEDSQFD